MQRERLDDSTTGGTRDRETNEFWAGANFRFLYCGKSELGLIVNLVFPSAG